MLAFESGGGRGVAGAVADDGVSRRRRAAGKEQKWEAESLLQLAEMDDALKGCWYNGGPYVTGQRCGNLGPRQNAALRAAVPIR